MNLSERLGEVHDTVGGEHAPEAGHGIEPGEVGGQGFEAQIPAAEQHGCEQGDDQRQSEDGRTWRSARAVASVVMVEIISDSSTDCSRVRLRLAHHEPVQTGAHVTAEIVQAAADGQHDRGGAELRASGQSDLSCAPPPGACE